MPKRLCSKYVKSAEMKTDKLKTMLSKLWEGCKRFPIAILSWALACALLCYLIHFDDKGVSIYPTMLSFLNAMAITSVAVKLLTETWERRKTLLAWLIGTAIIVAFHLWLLLTWEWNMIQVSAIMGLYTAIVACVFLLPFLKEQNDLPLWNYTLRLVAGIIIAEIGTAILMGGLLLLPSSLHELFGTDSSWSHYESYVSFICLQFIAPVIILQFIPQQEKMHNTSDKGLPKVLNGVVRFVLLPLFILYMVIVYAYGAKILFTWTLPNGWVSGLATALMAIMLALLLLLYPSRFHAERKLDNLLFRWLPILVLPILILMSVAIGRRLSDYGISVPRLYLLTLNLWCYFACGYLIYNKGRRMWLLPVTFALVALLTSIGPWSYAHIVKRSFVSSIKKSLRQNHITALPMNDKTVDAWVSKLPKQQAGLLLSRMDVLRDAYNKEGLEDIADSLGVVEATSQLSNYYDKGDFSLTTLRITGFYHYPRTITLPEGCRKMAIMDNENCQLENIQGDRVFLNISMNYTTYHITLSKQNLRKVAESNDDEATLKVKAGDKLIVITRLSDLSMGDEDERGGSVSGYIFY